MVWLLLEQHPTASHRVRVLAFAAGAAAGRGADGSGTLTSPASPCSVTSPVALLPMQPAGAPQVCGGAAVRHERLRQVHAGVHPGALGAAGQALLAARAGGQHGSISWVGRHEGGLQLDHGGLAVHPVASPTPCLLDHRTPPTFQPAPPGHLRRPTGWGSTPSSPRTQCATCSGASRQRRNRPCSMPPPTRCACARGPARSRQLLE